MPIVYASSSKRSSEVSKLMSLPQSNVQAKPSFLQKVGKVGSDALSFIGNNLGRANYAVANMAKVATDKKSDSFLNILKAGGRGFALKEKTTFSDVLSQAGMKDSFGKSALGFGLDIALDPTTYLTLGAGAGAKITAKVGTKSIAKTLTKAGSKALEDTTQRIATNMLKDAGTKLTEREAMVSARATAEKVINRAIKTDPKYAAKYVDKGGIKFAGKTIAGTEKWIDPIVEAKTALTKKLGGLFVRDAKIVDNPRFIRLEQKSRDLVHSDMSRFEDMVINGPMTKLPKDRMEVVARAIDNGTWRKLDGADYDAALGMKKLDKEMIKYSRDAGVPISEIENHITHIYKNRPESVDAILSKTKDKVTITDGFTKKRQFKNYDQAIHAGLEPEFDLIKIAEARISSAVRSANRTRFLRETGKEFGIPASILETVEKELPENIKSNQKLATRIAKNQDNIAELGIEKDIKLSDRKLMEEVIQERTDTIKSFRGEQRTAGSLDTNYDIRGMYNKHLDDVRKVKDLYKKDAKRTNKEIAKLEKKIEELTGKTFANFKAESKKIVNKIDNPELVKVTDILQNVDTRELKNVMIPKDIVDYIKTIDKQVFDEENISKFLKGYDAIQNSWKAGMTVAFPAFHFRNSVTNVMQNILDVGLFQALNPKLNFMATVILSGKNSGAKISIRGKEYTAQELSRLMSDLGVLGSPGYFDVAGKTSKLNLGRRTGSWIENEARATNFLANMMRSGDPVTSAERTKKFLFDYGNISNAEKAVIKRVMPFWTWPSRNFALLAGQMITNPGKIGAFTKAYNLTKTGNEGEWLENRFSIKMPDNKYFRAVFGDTKDKYLYGLGVPLESFADISSNPFKSTIQMLSPIFKGLVEIGTGVDTFTGNNVKDMGTSGTDILRIIPDDLQEKLGIFSVTKKDKNGEEYTKLKVHPYMALFLRSLSTSRASSTMGKLSDERTSIFEKTLNTFTGINSATSSEEDIYKALEKKYKEQAAKPLIARGFIKEGQYGSYYLDKNVVMSSEEQQKAREILKVLNTSYVKTKKISNEKVFKPLNVKSEYSRKDQIEAAKKSVYRKKI